MGMAASQVRFLSLQSRKNTIGLNLMTLSNRKLALSRDMNRVAAEYNDAMNQKVLKWSGDSGVTYQGLNYDLLMKPNENNATLPYIVTDAQGRVVVDDKVIQIDGANNPNNITYRQLAAMISAYSGTDADGKTTYNNIDNVKGIAAGVDVVDKDTTTNKINSVSNTGVSGGAILGDNQYEIISEIGSFHYENSLRYDLMAQLGLISASEKEAFDDTINELYGNQDGYENATINGDNMDALLEDFDEDKVKTAAEIGSDYSKYFGALNTAGADFTIDGGSAVGNLSLAKAYLAEYQAYLNTEFKADIIADTRADLGTSTSTDISNMDNTNTTSYPEYIYHEDESLGVSHRIMDLLEEKGDAVKTGDKYQLIVGGFLKNLGFVDDAGNASNITNTIGAVAGDEKGSDIAYDGDNNGAYDIAYNKGSAEYTSITSWGQLFDNDYGTNNKDAAHNWGSYDTDGDGYFKGSDYIDNGNNSQTGYAYHIWTTNDGNKTPDGAYNKIEKIIGCLNNSMKSNKNIDEAGANWAAQKTYELYNNNRQAYEDRNGDHGMGTSWNRGAGVSDNVFGTGWCNRFGHRDAIWVNLPNLINAYITFYEMYMAVNGDTSRIAEGTNRTLKPEIMEAYSAYDTDLANKMKNNNNSVNTNVMVDEFNSWKSAGGTVTAGSTPSGTGTQTIKYTRTTTTKEENDDGVLEDVTSTEYAEVTGFWNGSSWNSISKIKYSFLNGSSEYTTKTLEYSSSDASNSQIVQTNYSLTEDESGNITGTKKSEVVTYKYNYNSTTGSGTGIQADIQHFNTSGGLEYTIKTTNNSLDGIYNAGGAAISESNDNFYTNGKTYYITEGNGSNLPDANYKYLIDVNNVKNSVFASTITIKPEDKYGDQLQKLVDQCQARVDELQSDLEDFYNAFENRGMDYFDAIFKMIAENGWVYDENVNSDDKEESKNYLNAMLQNNMYFVTEVDTLDGTDFNYATKLATNVSKIFEVYDEDAQNQALSKYEAEKAEINSKEKQVDIRMNKLETEQDAIKTELDSLKKIIDDNVQATFKIFT